MTTEQQLASDYSIEYLQTGNTISQRPRLATECALILESAVIEILSEGENPHLPSEGGRQLANLYIFLDRPATGLRALYPKISFLELNRFIIDCSNQILLSTYRSIPPTPTIPKK
ncbi:hypothetical protein EYR41_008859 [Orbilia oligospora]|uniref:Uncharacterized protein n=1 Tax=Orbilia oligospora TaxID=2813651 RepID=A0A7C8NSG5_ORBOL|nr:hypothetical protein TWF751_003536 [Orbilia oligospora]TGJ64849.1 hypothetical protein EYR41_008859 [Orbilia oligospora]